LINYTNDNIDDVPWHSVTLYSLTASCVEFVCIAMHNIDAHVGSSDAGLSYDEHYSTLLNVDDSKASKSEQCTNGL